MELKKETHEFLAGLDEDDLKNLSEILENKKHRKWIFLNSHYLVKGLLFLITSWIAIEVFIKQYIIKLFH